MKKISFRISKECGLSIYEQVKNQIVSSMYTGKIKAGDVLPSVRELASAAGVNPKTICRLYQTLEAENYLQAIPGRGVFVREFAKADFSAERGEALHRLIQNTLEKASLLGWSRERFAELIYQYATGRGLAPFACALVDDPEELHAFSAELRQESGFRICPVRLEDIGTKLTAANPRLQHCRLILTTSWHLEAVKPYADRLGWPVLEIKTNPEIYNEILHHAQTCHTGVVVRDRRTLHASFELLADLYYPDTQKHFLVATLDDRERLTRMAKEAGAVFCSPACVTRLRRFFPPGFEIRTFKRFISPDFISQLRLLRLLSRTRGDFR